jgi:hypothetical protein
MAEEVLKLEPASRESQQGKRWSAALPILIFVYLIVWACTGAHFMADTNVYTQAILRHQYGGGVVDYRQTTANPFWDFGHILWRPLGWLSFVITAPVTQLFVHQNHRAQVLLTLLGINFVASLGCVILFFLLARRVIGDERCSLLATVGFFSADAFLDYSHSGNAYVVGVACLVAGMYVLWSENVSDHSLGRASIGRAMIGRAPIGRAMVAALLFALAVLFWFPYIFMLPAAMAAPLWLYGREAQRRRLIGQTVVVCAVIGLAVYASAIAAVGIRNVADLREWILAAGHGQIQPGGVRAAARLAFSVPRSFVNMDRDGMWLKRYLVDDPYSPVSTGSLFGYSLWKLGMFYASATVVCVELLRSKRGRILLFLLAATVLPIFVFAVFIFEAGSIERYLPLFPFVFLAFGYVLASPQSKRASKILLLVALTAVVAVNLNAMRRGTLESRRAAAVGRIHDLVPLLTPESLVLAVSEQDSLAEFRQNFPLDPINVDTKWRAYDVLEINTERLATWREDLAKRVLGTWQQGGTVWLPVRFLSAKPKPEWNWVEGDDKRVQWTDLPMFFSQFDTGPEVGGDDGFVPLQDNQKNMEILRPLSGELQSK